MSYKVILKRGPLPERIFIDELPQRAQLRMDALIDLHGGYRQVTVTPNDENTEVTIDASRYYEGK